MLIENFTYDDLCFVNYIDCSDKTKLEILSCRNLPEVSKWMKNSETISIENHLSFIDTLSNNTDKLYFAILKDDSYIGSIYIIRDENDNLERGIFIHPKYQGTGLSSKIEHAFSEQLKLAGVVRLYAEVALTNHKSIAFHEKLGYERVGIDDKYIIFIRQL